MPSPAVVKTDCSNISGKFSDKDSCTVDINEAKARMGVQFIHLYILFCGLVLFVPATVVLKSTTAVELSASLHFHVTWFETLLRVYTQPCS